MRKYVQAREGKTFRPHATSFHADDANVVHLSQEISFSWGPQATLRRQLLEFWRVAGRCYQMLEEIALEEELAALPKS